MRLAITALACLLLSVPEVSAREGARPPRTLKVAAVQLRSKGDVPGNLKAIEAALKSCAEKGVAIAVFPECAVTGYSAEWATGATAEQLAAAEKTLADACRRHRIAAVVGSPWREGGKLFNSALVIDASGKVVERYHKVQLAENWPAAGDHLSVFTLAGVRCSVIICHDERYPELVRLPVLAGARLVFYISHESGIRQESKVGPYRAQIQARAVENGVYIAQANAPANPDATGSHGQSRIIAPDGNILAEASVFGDETTIAEIEPAKAGAQNARMSVSRGPLGDWWREGIKRVRVLD